MSLLARPRVALLGAWTIPAALAVLLAGAAAHADPLVPAAAHSYPGWLSGPLATLHVPTGRGLYQGLIILISGAYLLVLAHARALRPRTLWPALATANLLPLLGPPLFSADVLGYIAYARLGVLHHLNPYTHGAAAAPGDPVLGYIGWPYAHSPYGPLFTLGSYALVPLGIGGALWALKAVAVTASLATARLLQLDARHRGRNEAFTLAFFGLNPMLLVFAVGGAHNDLLLSLVVTGALVATLATRERAAAGINTAAVALKASALLALPFLVLAARRRAAVLLIALGSLAVVWLLALVAFHSPTAALLDTLRGQQQSVAIHSLPSETSRLLGLGRLASGIRVAYLLLLGLILLLMLVRTLRDPAAWLESYGWSVLALLATTAWLLPWYGTWALAPATLGTSRRLRVATLVACAYLIATRMPLSNPLLG